MAGQFESHGGRHAPGPRHDLSLRGWFESPAQAGSRLALALTEPHISQNLRFNYRLSSDQSARRQIRWLRLRWRLASDAQSRTSPDRGR